MSTGGDGSPDAEELVALYLIMLAGCPLVEIQLSVLQYNVLSFFKITIVLLGSYRLKHFFYLQTSSKRVQLIRSRC